MIGQLKRSRWPQRSRQRRRRKSRSHRPHLHRNGGLTSSFWNNNRL